MGAGRQFPARSVVETASQNVGCCHIGGQSAPSGFFGIPALKRAERHAAFVAQDKASAQHTLTVRLPSTRRPAVAEAMQYAVAAQAADQRDAQEWRELADLAACPEWDRHRSYGSVERACALND